MSSNDARALEFGAAGVAVRPPGDPGRSHAYPLDRGHVLSRDGCWCGPDYYEACPACMGRGCHECRGGFVACDHDEASIVVHKGWC